MGFQIEHFGVIPLVFPMAIMISFLFSLLGTIIASQVNDMEAFPTVMNLLVLPMFFLSGALFPISNLPPAVVTITRFNPMTYGVNLLQDILNLNLSPSNILDLVVLAVLIAILLLIGTNKFNKIET